MKRENRQPVEKLFLQLKISEGKIASWAILTPSSEKD